MKQTLQFFVRQFADRSATTIIGLAAFLGGIGVACTDFFGVGIALSCFGFFLLAVPLFFGIVRIKFPFLEVSVAEWLQFYSSGWGFGFVILTDFAFCLGIENLFYPNFLPGGLQPVLLTAVPAFGLIFTFGILGWNHLDSKTENTQWHNKLMSL